MELEVRATLVVNFVVIVVVVVVVDEEAVAFADISLRGRGGQEVRQMSIKPGRQ